MTTISRRQRLARLHGFTLVEVMVAATISVMILASITSTLLVFGKTSTSVGNYVDMSVSSQHTLQLFSRDVRSANAITVTSPQSKTESGVAVVYSEAGIKLSFPASYSASEVTYVYDSTTGALTRSADSGTARVLVDGITSFEMRFYDKPGSSFSAEPGPLASVNTWTKSIQLDAELIRAVNTAGDNTDYIISARFMMRNN